MVSLSIRLSEGTLRVNAMLLRAQGSISKKYALCEAGS